MPYTATAISAGGRDGRAILADDKLALSMSVAKEMGGSGHGHNPEQLFALGWSACFNQAVLALAKKHNIDGQAARVMIAVTLDVADGKPFLKAAITLAVPGAPKENVEALLNAAHNLCPYSRATSGNVPVTLAVG